MVNSFQGKRRGGSTTWGQGRLLTDKCPRYRTGGQDGKAVLGVKLQQLKGVLKTHGVRHRWIGCGKNSFGGPTVHRQQQVTQLFEAQPVALAPPSTSPPAPAS